MSFMKISRQLLPRVERSLFSRRYFQSGLHSEMLQKKAAEWPHLLKIYDLFKKSESLFSPKYKKPTLSDSSWDRLLNNPDASRYQSTIFSTVMASLVKLGFPQELLDSLVLYPEHANDIYTSPFFIRLEELQAQASKDGNWDKFNNAFDVASVILAHLAKWPHLERVFECFNGLAVYDKATIQKVVSLPSVNILVELGSVFNIPLDLALATASFGIEAIAVMRKHGKYGANSLAWNITLLNCIHEKHCSNQSLLLTERDLKTLEDAYLLTSKPADKAASTESQSSSPSNFFSKVETPKKTDDTFIAWMDVAKPMDPGF